MKMVLSLLIVFLCSLSVLFAQPVIDGDLSDAEYVSIATKQNANSGFGSSIDVTEILYYADVGNSILYLGVKCIVNNSSADGIGLWLDFSELTGLSAGTSLGGSPGSHYMTGNGGANPNFKADFEVDYMMAWNPGSNPANCFVDIVKLAGARSHEYLGDCGQSGSSITNIGGIFSAGSVTFAFQNGGGAQGFEISIPFNELGVTSSGTFRVFAFVVSSTAFFSNVTVPGNITSGNPGFNADFNLISGGPYHTSPDVSLPVTLSSFRAYGKDGEVLLRWVTQSEVDNEMFILDRSSDGVNFTQMAQIPGAGNSNITNRYSFTDHHVINGVTYYYRLADRDYAGNIAYHNSVSATPKEGVKVIQVDPEIPQAFRLYANFPNPFNPKTTIKFDLSSQTADEQPVNLSIYNTSGQRIATLVNRTLPNGTYEADWNGSNDNGVQVSSGVYLYRLSTPDFVSTKKLMLIR